MKKAILALVCLLLALPAYAAEPVNLGFSRLLTNDYFGDGQDRWHTGSYQISFFRGPQWRGVRPDTLGELLEFRLQSEIIAPSNLARPAANDRPYVSILSFGVHSYAERAGFELSTGLDLIATGPQTGGQQLQRAAHSLFGMARPDVNRNRIGNAFRPTLSFELGRDFSLGGGRARLRPFVQAQAGAETFVRIGGDLTIGRFGLGALRVRNAVTGQLTPGIRVPEATGLSFVLGADIAKVTDSYYLPSSRGYNLASSRRRLRVGVHWGGAIASAFYGITYLSKEFARQRSGQTVGSFTWYLKF